MTQLIITHSGRFHLDETFAVTLLTYLFSDYKLVRTRESNFLAEEVKNTNSILIDVGWSYNPENQNYDHHMVHNDLLITKKGSILNITLIRQEIRKNIKDYLAKNWIYISEEDSNKFIQKFRSLESNERFEINLEQYKIDYLSQDIKKYLEFIKSTYSVIDPLNKLENIINSPTAYYKEFYNLFDYRKYSSFGLIWKHYGKQVLKTVSKKENLNIKQEYLDELIDIIDIDLVKKVDNLDNGVGNTSSLGSIIENYNTLDTNNHNEQYNAFISATEFLKGYFVRYLKKEVKELEDLKGIQSEYKVGETVQYFSQYYRGIDPFILSTPNDETRFIVFKKDEDKYVLKTLQIWDFQSKELLPSEWLVTKPEGCTFIHPALFISEFNSLESIKNIFNN